MDFVPDEFFFTLGMSKNPMAENLGYQAPSTRKVTAAPRKPPYSLDTARKRGEGEAPEATRLSSRDVRKMKLMSDFEKIASGQFRTQGGLDSRVW